MIFVDFIMEAVILMPLGGYTYSGAPDWTSVNIDHYYKYTFLEGLTFGASWSAWAALRYFKDDKGRTIVERGIDKVEAPTRKTALRFFAIGAFVSLTMFTFTTVPWNWMALHQSEWPEDVQKRSYFTQGLCGADTTFACAGPSAPLPRADKSGILGPTARSSSRRARSCRSSYRSTGGSWARRVTDAAEAGPVGGPAFPN